MAVSIASLPPHEAPWPWRADRVCGGPGDHALGRREAVGGWAWPTRGGHHRATQVDPGLSATRQEGVGGHLARIAQLVPRGSWRVTKGACMVGSPATSEVVAGVVVTSVLRVGVAASQVAVTCTL
jgi:hypothetical protein